MIRLQVVLIPPNTARSNRRTSNIVTSSLQNSGFASSPVASSTPTNLIAGDDYRKMLHLATPGQTMQQVCDDIIDRFSKLYPEEALEVEKLQDVNECDLDPDYCVQDVFTDNNPLLVILQKPFKTGRYSASRVGKRKASVEHSQEMKRPKKSRRSSSIWMRNRDNESEGDRERDGFVFTPLGSNSKENRDRRRSPSIELSDNVGRPVSNYVIDDSAHEEGEDEQPTEVSLPPPPTEDQVLPDPQKPPSPSQAPLSSDLSLDKEWVQLGQPGPNGSHSSFGSPKAPAKRTYRSATKGKRVSQGHQGLQNGDQSASKKQRVESEKQPEGQNGEEVATGTEKGQVELRKQQEEEKKKEAEEKKKTEAEEKKKKEAEEKKRKEAEEKERKEAEEKKKKEGAARKEEEEKKKKEAEELKKKEAEEKKKKEEEEERKKEAEEKKKKEEEEKKKKEAEERQKKEEEEKKQKEEEERKKREAQQHASEQVESEPPSSAPSEPPSSQLDLSQVESSQMTAADKKKAAAEERKRKAEEKKRLQEEKKEEKKRLQEERKEERRRQQEEKKRIAEEKKEERKRQQEERKRLQEEKKKEREEKKKQPSEEKPQREPENGQQQNTPAKTKETANGSSDVATPASKTTSQDLPSSILSHQPSTAKKRTQSKKDSQQTALVGEIESSSDSSSDDDDDDDDDSDNDSRRSNSPEPVKRPRAVNAPSSSVSQNQSPDSESSKRSPEQEDQPPASEPTTATTTTTTNNQDQEKPNDINDKPTSSQPLPGVSGLSLLSTIAKDIPAVHEKTHTAKEFPDFSQNRKQQEKEKQQEEEEDDEDEEEEDDDDSDSDSDSSSSDSDSESEGDDVPMSKKAAATPKKKKSNSGFKGLIKDAAGAAGAFLRSKN
ncbi:hypothetical protein TRICI_003836 [Trichomonascus ciferrii]|uniref:Nucleolar protein Dnt1-like N-terminal domain-containing protein n=1 Tax=Trichomonascus ciferrii TaxID=44093 RepID=A0A642V402_9ASCO|nr:hypothetical protein TRICI_003836 [Trichomonascus ciferrii]